MRRGLPGPGFAGRCGGATQVEHQRRALSRQAVSGGGDFRVAAEKIGLGPGA
jgi:hypothetical protein